MKKTYDGSCHCGAVRFQADIDLSAGTNKCNCSICAKSRAWFAFVPGAAFRLTEGAGSLTEYRWTPAGKPEPFLRYNFCRTCGIRAYARGEHESMGGVFYAVPVTSLDEVDADELVAAPVNYVDGLHDRFKQKPEDTRLL